MIDLRPLREQDIDAHNSGEDDEAVRWLSGRPATVESTRRHFAMLADNAARGAGKRGFGVWLDGTLAGYVDLDPDASGLPRSGDVNIAYAVHPWARRRAVATTAVSLICEEITAERIGTRAIIRAEPSNIASIRVAERSGFEFLTEIASETDRHADGSPVLYAVYARELGDQQDGR